MYYLDSRVENLYRIFDQNARKDYLRLDLNENPGGLPQEFIDDGSLRNYRTTSPWISGAVRNKKRKKFKNQAEHKSHPGSCYSKRISINSVVFRIFENIRKTQSVTFV